MLLLTSDLHLTSSPRDEYRWGIFKLLRQLVKKKDVDSVMILGDITDQKDYHSSVLVNRVADELQALTKVVKGGVLVLKGNHDGIDPDMPYFRFLNHLSKVRFIHEIAYTTDGTLWLPHTRDPLKDWGMRRTLIKDSRYIFMHATLAGAVAEAGVKLEGISADWFADTKAWIFSGDVHVPQRLHGVQYLGAPYPIRFGDSFKPCVWLLDQEKDNLESIPTKFLQRHALTIGAMEDWDPQMVNKGDQVKVKLELSRADFANWQELKHWITKQVQEQGAELVGIELVDKEREVGRSAAAAKVKKETPKEIFARYCKARRIDEKTMAAGEEML